MASFQAKIVWKRPRKVENKKYRVVTFLPDSLQKIPKKNKKIKKIKKYHYGVISSPNRLEKAQRENKNYRFVSFLPVA